MSKNFAIIGGDLRSVILTKMLANDNNKIYTYGLEKVEELKNYSGVINVNALEELALKSEIIIGPMPFSKDNEKVNAPFSNKEITIKECLEIITNQVFIAGSFSNNVKGLIKEKNIKAIDLLEQEELAVLNSIATAEGAIGLAIQNTNAILHKSKVLILGFGRISKVLASKLKALSINVTCAARKQTDLAWIETYGYEKTNINMLGENLGEYDIIFNTVPHLIITKERLNYIKKDCVLIELASKPGGFTEEANVIPGNGLPGKVAPVTSAKFIKDTIYNVIKGIEKI